MKFICDVMLGRLAKCLRILGLDAIYIKNYKDLAHIVDKESKYFFFTKRSKNAPKGSILIKSDHVKEQLKEILPVIRDYLDENSFFTRCLNCNTLLVHIDREEIEGLVPEYVFHNHLEFKKCLLCNKIYWSGTHIAHMEAWIGELLSKKLVENK